MKHPTLRTLGGAMNVQEIQAEKTALLVIDFQKEYFYGALPIPEGLAALMQANRLIQYADEKTIKVFHIKHVAPAGSAAFAEDSVMSEFHADILLRTEHKFVKKNLPSVFASTNIDEQLKQSGIHTLIICGLMTHMCVSAAAREAVPLGYEIIVAADACATRSVDLDDEETINYDILHKASLATLGDAFGAIMNTEEIIRL